MMILFLNISIAYSQIQQVIPPSPTASALGQYIDNPVSLYTGKPVIKIPLYQINMNDFSLPISLSYDAKGIQVGQVASNVGLGWSLNAGGIITRSVHGSPDDLDVRDFYKKVPDYEYPYYDFDTGVLRHKINLDLDINILNLYYFRDFVDMGIFSESGLIFNQKNETEPDVLWFSRKILFRCEK